jgi:hypothetical protein
VQPNLKSAGSAATVGDHGWVNATKVLKEEHFGLGDVDDWIWSVYIRPGMLGALTERELKIYGAQASNQPP